MEIEVKHGALTKTRGGVCLVGCFEETFDSGAAAEIDHALGGTVKETAKEEGFHGKFLQTLLIRTAGKIGFARLLLIGLGKPSELTLDRVRQAAGRGAAEAWKRGCEGLFLYCDPSLAGREPMEMLGQALVEGIVLGTYRFDRFKTDPSDQKPIGNCTLVAPEENQCGKLRTGAERGRIVADSACFVRDLCNTPSNLVTPARLAEEAEKLGEAEGVRVEILEREDIARLGMGAFLAVAQGTAEPPKFIIVEYHGKPGPRMGRPIALIGKSVTFDSGGISLKPSDRMDQMKYDMSGGATVLGVMRAAIRLKLPLDLVARLPATDNMPSGTAVHPGDVVTTLSGKTVEVINTDAEGRLLLADALAYAARYKPTAMIDLATLTGACVVALGQHAIGLMGNNSRLAAKLKAAGEATGERVWELPLWDDYFKQIKGEVADLKNVGGRAAGSITAGLFLKQFVGDIPWAHFDIAGTSWFHDGEHPYIPKGATGIGTRLLLRYLAASVRKP